MNFEVDFVAQRHSDLLFI